MYEHGEGRLQLSAPCLHQLQKKPTLQTHHKPSELALNALCEIDLNLVQKHQKNNKKYNVKTIISLATFACQPISNLKDKRPLLMQSTVMEQLKLEDLDS